MCEWWVAINSEPHRIWVGFQFTSRVQRKRKQLVARTLKKNVRENKQFHIRNVQYTYVSYWKAPYKVKMNHSIRIECTFSCTLCDIFVFMFVCFFSGGCLIWSRLISDCYTLQIRPQEFIVHLICKIQFQLKWCGISSERRLQTHNADNVNKIWSVATDCNLNKILFTFTRCRGQSTLGNQESWVLVTLLFV